MEQLNMRCVVWLILVATLAMGKDYETYCRVKYRGISPTFITKIIYKVSSDVGIDPWLIYAVIKVESNFDICATSHAGAIGLMQVLPSTAKLFEPNITVDRLYNPVINIRIGTYYLKALLDYYNHIYKDYREALFRALLAYNAGVRKEYTYISLKYTCKVLKVYSSRSAVVFYPEVCRRFEFD